jgi:hypothetical protein
MVYIENEFVTKQMMTKFVESIHVHDCECFLISRHIIPFIVVEQLRYIGNWLVIFPVRFCASIVATTILEVYV